MVNSKKTIKRERTRLRKSQNPQQLDFLRMRKAQKIKTKYWASKKRSPVSESVVVEDKKKKPKKDKPKKDKKAELEVVEDEPELEVIDKELEELYDYDDEENEEDDAEEELPE